MKHSNLGKTISAALDQSRRAPLCATGPDNYVTSSGMPWPNRGTIARRYENAGSPEIIRRESTNPRSALYARATANLSSRALLDRILLTYISSRINREGICALG